MGKGKRCVGREGIVDERNDKIIETEREWRRYGVHEEDRDELAM